MTGIVKKNSGTQYLAEPAFSRSRPGDDETS